MKSSGAQKIRQNSSWQGCRSRRRTDEAKQGTCGEPFTEGIKDGLGSFAQQMMLCEPYEYVQSPGLGLLPYADDEEGVFLIAPSKKEK